MMQECWSPEEPACSCQSLPVLRLTWPPSAAAKLTAAIVDFLATRADMLAAFWKLQFNFKGPSPSTLCLFAPSNKLDNLHDVHDTGLRVLDLDGNQLTGFNDVNPNSHLQVFR